jgi:hypothetical protein
MIVVTTILANEDTGHQLELKRFFTWEELDQAVDQEGVKDRLADEVRSQFRKALDDANK